MDVNALATYNYNLPEELIAHYPCEQRDHSRLMIVDRSTGTLSEIPFYELPHLLHYGDRLIFNNTKVIPARLHGKRETGGLAEIFLIKEVGEDQWEVLCRPARKLRVGSKVSFSETFYCEVLEEREEGERLVKFYYEGEFNNSLEKYGEMPLPHYMRRHADKKLDTSRYQTVYAQHPGAVAAPTAGLHFTPELLRRLESRGVHKTELTLHVGLGTFRPVQVDDIRDHKMHSEEFNIGEDTAKELNEHTGGRLICVGTTSCRTLESLPRPIVPGEYATDIFIYPGYRFQGTDALLTNFHLPGSTLLMLVSAFGGYELMMEAYKKAVREKFRFYSYGDAMLIL